MSIVLAMPIVAGVVSWIKKRPWTHIFFVMFIYATCALGWRYNSISRMGNIFLSDLYLLAFFVVYIIENKLVLYVDKKDFEIIVSVVVFQTLLGLLSGFAITDILTDFKYILYFFIPYIYLKNIHDDGDLMRDLFAHYAVIIIISLILNWMNLFSNGLSNVNAGGTDILRTFAIGLGFSCGALISCLMTNYREQFVARFGVIPYYLIQILLLVSCIASFTRTCWIAYAFTIALNWIFVRRKNISSSGIIAGVFHLIFAGILVAAVALMIWKVYPQIITGIVNRFLSIKASISGTQTEYNTFNARINNILEGADVFFSPRIIIGYGYGSLYKNLSGYHNGCENSFIYYMWKYGLVMAFYLFARIIMKVKRLWQSHSVANRAFVIYFLCEIFIGSLSGNYNYAYGLGMISFLMGLNYDLIFDGEAPLISEGRMN